jgi:hypothetical protein
MTSRVLPFLLILFCGVASAEATEAIPDVLLAIRAQASPGLAALPAFEATGTQSSEGLDAQWREIVDRRSGAYAITATHPVRSTADGLDAEGRWHRDVSGGVHPFDSDEAKVVAVTEAWLLRYGWLDNDRTTYRDEGEVREGGRTLRRLVATPPDGRDVALWFDEATKQLRRAQWRSSFLTFTRDFSDYRDTVGVSLPYRFVTVAKTDSGTEDGSETVRIDRYRRLDDAALATALARPPRLPGDVTMRGETQVASVPMTLEGGALLVDVSINGAAPLPFILDTGGHAILTETAARKLGVRGQGKGVSTGSGPGSMPTSYAHVDTLGLGEASVRDQTFLIMPFGFGFSDRGEREPIAGILGLEVFERFAVTFDYDRRRLLLAPFDVGAAPAAPMGTSVPLRFTFDMPVIDGTLDGKPGVFGIDTGNSGRLLIFPQWLERNGLIDRYRKGYALVGGGGVGGPFVSRLSHVESLGMGSLILHGHIAQLTPPDAGATANVSEAGNIGQDVLSRFTVHIDYRRAAMTLAPRAVAAKPGNADPGLRAGRKPDQPDRFIVSAVVPGSPAAKAGIRIGDAILTVNGVTAARLGGWGLRDVFDQASDGRAVVLGMANGRKVTLRLVDFAPG